MLSLRKISVALCITTLSSLSFAQSTAPATTPDRVGVEPTEAREAMERAQRRDAEAAVIRTDESAAQKARDAAAATRDGTAAVGDRARDAVGRDTDSDRNQIARAPRADRN